MTDIELLPLPVRNYVDGDGLWETAAGPYSAEETQAYARAVAEHNVAARDAEIEALRGQVDEWKRRGEAYFQTAEQQGKRAERLAEALQWYAEQAEGCRKIGSIGEPFRKELDRDGGKRARAALRDHDQEGKDG